MKADYQVRMNNGQSFLLACDMSQASAGIWTNWTGEKDGWSPIPYQTADARHELERAAKLANDYSAQSDEERAAQVASIEELP